MQRQIKFRVWDKVNKIYKLDTGAYFIRQDGILELQKATMGGRDYNGKDCYTSLSYPLYDNYIVQQFTGLKDKNGKEIYEGDIVKDLDKEFGVIEFNNGSFILNTKNRIIPFWSVFVQDNMVYPRQINTNTLEIFGNIFENSELLESK